MTDDQIKDAIRSDMPFFAVTRNGDFLARYVWLGPAFLWQRNRMMPTMLQSDDLCWWLQSAADEGHSIGGIDRGGPGEEG